MRLNRGTAIFFVVLVIIIGAAYALMNSDIGGPAEPTATPLVRQPLFPNLASTDVSAIKVIAQLPVEDTRATPLPGAEPLPTLTPVPEGEDEPTTTEILSIARDEAGVWQVAEDSTVTAPSTIVPETIDGALRSITSAQAEAFIPESGDYAQYGLDKPSHEVIFVVSPAVGVPATEGETQAEITRRLQIGKRTLDNLGYYVFLDDDSETVYIMSGASAFQTNVLNLVTTPPFAPTPTPIPPVAVNIPGSVFAGFNQTIASRVELTDNQTGASLVLTKAPDAFDWTIEGGDPNRTVNQASVTTAFIDMSSIQAVSRASIEDLASVGLDNPSYSIHAEFIDGRTIDVQLGIKDPTSTLYYTLINDMSDVVLVNAREFDALLANISNPPYTVEVTPEVTPEMTAEATADAESQAVEEATEEMTAEATEASSD